LYWRNSFDSFMELVDALQISEDFGDRRIGRRSLQERASRAEMGLESHGREFALQVGQRAVAIHTLGCEPT
jgi:hypothetical protein